MPWAIPATKLKPRELTDLGIYRVVGGVSKLTETRTPALVASTIQSGPVLPTDRRTFGRGNHGGFCLALAMGRAQGMLGLMLG